ncbi:MAG TPA: ParB/RepB/Spo0J family partition protein [Bacillota bacterium]|nr:ParB/RepB/Spo0J family partition protein [Bacillota bacterium]HUM55590.1 ParB/RepB/Spo0J family partition protein [Bacillota bacterium]
MAKPKNKGLGRGLEALMGEASIGIREKDGEERGIEYIDINNIKPNRNQPRKVFSEEKINELADSIKEHGVIQPLIVRTAESGYELVAGERRWRAARTAGLKEVPCILRKLTEEENMLLAVVENMQREDLNPIEEAEGLGNMIEAFGLTQEQISKSVGKSRPYITNALRLLKLPDEIKEMISSGKISQGHGRVLLSVSDRKKQFDLAKRIVKEDLSVRVTEALAEEKKEKGKKTKARKMTKNPDVLQIERELKDALGTKVSINMKGKKGRIEIEYYSKEELERLIDLLKEKK